MRKFIGVIVLAASILQTANASGPVPQDVMSLELATLDGEAFVKLSDFAGKPVLVNMWGSECPPCIKETPLLNAQARKFGSVQFLGVATDDRVASQRFVAKYQVSYPQLQAPKDPSGMLRRFGNPHGALPYTVMLNPDHRICMRKLGAVDELWIATAVQQCS